MIGLNWFQPGLSQALPQNKVKERVMPCCGIRVALLRGPFTTNLHRGKVYQSSRRKGVGGRGGHPDKIPRKKSKAQDPAQGPVYLHLTLHHPSYPLPKSKIIN